MTGASHTESAQTFGSAGPRRGAVPAAPRVAALGGGHGQAAVLRALQRFAGDIAAVVTVADDGGSSGRLVRELGIPPPGDARRNLLALCEGSELADLFDYRFERGDLAGHSLGNLILAALAGMEGDFTEALARAGDILGAVGRVFPAATEAVSLVADVGGMRVEGQEVIKHRRGIRRVGFDPPDPPACPGAVEAIERADLVVIGPGSLFTSILPVVCVPGIHDALERSGGVRVLVGNLTVQRGETEGMDVSAHMEAFLDNAGKGLVDVTLVNVGPVRAGRALAPPAEDEISGVPVARAAVAADHGAVHDPERLAAALRALSG